MTLKFLQGPDGSFDIANIVVDILQLVREHACRGIGLTVLMVEIKRRGAECDDDVVLPEEEALAAIRSKIEVGFLDLKGLEAGAEGCEANRNPFIRDIGN